MNSILFSDSLTNPTSNTTSNTTSTTDDFYTRNINRTFTSDDKDFTLRCHIPRSYWTYITDNKYTFVTEYDLVCAEQSLAALVSGCYHIGSLVGALLNGILSDRYGRKFVLVISAILLPFPTIGVWFVRDVSQLCVVNVVRGMASTGAYYNGYVYISEVAPPSVRALSTNVYMLFNCFSYLLVDLLAASTHNWRNLSVYMGVIALPLWCSFFFIPESPRWLHSRGRTEEAESVLAKLIDFSGKTKVSLAEPTVVSSKVKSYSCVDLLRNIETLKVTISLLGMWIVIPVLYFSISKFSISYGGNMYVNYACACLADIPALLLATFLISKTVGRRRVNRASFRSTGVLVGCILLVPKSFVYRHTVTMVITMAAKLTVVPAFVGIFLWTSEIYPTVVRSQGMAMCTIAEKLGMISFPFVTTLSQTVSYDFPFILISVAGIVAGLVGFSLPETKGQPTRENFEDMLEDDQKKTRNSSGGIDNMGLDSEGNP